MTEDEFEASQIWNFSETELSQLESWISSSTTTHKAEQEPGGPRLSIHVELESNSSTKESGDEDPIQIPRETESPYESYRARRGYLSVTDLVAPAW